MNENANQTSQYEDVFQKGCLVQFSVSQWSGNKKIDKRRVQEAMGSEWVHGNKSLIDPESLKSIQQVVNRSTVFLKSVSLPFPIRGAVFIPKNLIGRVDEFLTQAKADFDYNVDGFAMVYPNLRDNAQAMLNGLYDHDDYPADIRKKFGFTWRFIIVSTPGNHGVLTPEIYNAERQKFVEMMKSAQDMSIMALRKEMKDMVEHMLDKLTPDADGKQKRFHQTLVTNFHEFFKTFTDRNVFGDEELTGIVKKAEEILDGVDVEMLKDEFYGGEMKKKMEEVKAVLDTALVDLPGRRLRI